MDDTGGLAQGRANKAFYSKKKFYRPDVLLLKDLFHNVYNAVTKAPKTGWHSNYN
jgi:hypothetical protein